MVVGVVVAVEGVMLLAAETVVAFVMNTSSEVVNLLIKTVAVKVEIEAVDEVIEDVLFVNISS